MSATLFIIQFDLFYHLDIRFAAHGSPYYAPERMEGIIATEKMKIEKEIGKTLSSHQRNQYYYDMNRSCIKPKYQ